MLSKPITLSVYVSPALAVTAGVSRYGEGEYILAESDLASLAPDMRALLADSLDDAMRASGPPLALAAPTISWATVAPALLERLAAVRKDREKRAAEKERATKAAEEAIQLRTKSIIALRAFALGIEALAPAAKNGYDVSSGALDHIADQIRGDFAGAFVITGGTPEFAGAEWIERAAPRPSAFAVLDRVTRHVDEIRCPRASWSRPRIPACVQIEVSRIVRFTPASTRNSRDEEVLGQRITAIVVTVKAAGFENRTCAIVFPAES
jgi:hypothetical protein